MKLNDNNVIAIHTAAQKAASAIHDGYRLLYVNRPSWEESIALFMYRLKQNLIDFANSVICDNDELTRLEDYFKERYHGLFEGKRFAVILIDRMSKMQRLKERGATNDGWSQGDYIGTCSNPLYLVDERAHSSPRYNEFGIPKTGRTGSGLSKPCDLLGFCTKVTGRELAEITYSDVAPFPENILPDEEYYTIFMCIEALNLLPSSLREDDDGPDNKKSIYDCFGISVADNYFHTNGWKITFAHELAHLILGHCDGSVENKMNRETQANFLASIMLNNPISSVYMQYKSYFQPAEYQRTALLYTGFGFADAWDVLAKVLILK